MGGELPVAGECKQKLEVPERRFLQKGGPTPKHRDRVQRRAAHLLLRAPTAPSGGKEAETWGPSRRRGRALPRSPLLSL